MISSSEKHANSVRFFGDIQGCYVLSSREALGDDQVKVFACRSRSISVQQAVVSAPVAGKVGETVALRFDDLGLLKGAVRSTNADGFVADLQLNDRQQESLAARINWMRRRQLKGEVDRRESKRWLPRNPRSAVLLPGDTSMPCFIVNVSSSGVAVSADIMPEIGAPLAVGSVLGRVVRKLSLGFAVRFAAVQDALAIEALLDPPTGDFRQAMAHALDRATEAAPTA